MTVAEAQGVCLGRAGRCRAQIPADGILCTTCEAAGAETSRKPGLRRPATATFPLADVLRLPMQPSIVAASSAEALKARHRERVEQRTEWKRRTALARARGEWTDDDAAFAGAVKSRKMRAVADRWSLNSGGLLLTGPTGCGKTSAARRALRRLVRAATSERDPVLAFRWLTAVEIARARRNHPLGQGDPPIIEAAATASLLVLDELGHEALDESIFEVLDRRYVAQLRTIVTAGRPATELRERYGAACIRRIHEPGGAVIEAWDG